MPPKSVSDEDASAILRSRRQECARTIVIAADFMPKRLKDVLIDVGSGAVYALNHWDTAPDTILKVATGAKILAAVLATGPEDITITKGAGKYFQEGGQALISLGTELDKEKGETIMWGSEKHRFTDMLEALGKALEARGKAVSASFEAQEAVASATYNANEVETPLLRRLERSEPLKSITPEA